MRYIDLLYQTMDKIEMNGIRLNDGIEQVLNVIAHKILLCGKQGNKVIIIGNGGSAAIAAHTANDLINMGHVSALSLSNPAELTCMANDYGYENAYMRLIDVHAKKGDILIGISSSGKSKNILKAVDCAKEIGCYIWTLSGFDQDNPLRELGDLNLYVPSHQYGQVELCHQIILHMLTDLFVQQKEKEKKSEVYV